MQRFVAVGPSRLTMVGVVAHDSREVAPLLSALDTLAPGRIEVALSAGEWETLRHKPNGLTPLEARFYDRLVPLCPAQANAAWIALAGWAEANGAAVTPILLAEPPEPPKGRKGLKAVDKMIRREGFDAPTPRAALEKLLSGYMARLPDLRDAIYARYDAMADLLVKRYGQAPQRAVVVVPYPAFERVADMVTKRARARFGPFVYPPKRP